VGLGIFLSHSFSLFLLRIPLCPFLGSLWVVRALGLGSRWAALWPPWAEVVGGGLGHNVVGGRGL
jgi:hypothetical protein